MKVKRTATIAVVGGALAAWLAAATTSGNRDAVAPVVREPAPIDTRGAALAVEIAQLHDRLRPKATPRKPSRDLFAFAAAEPQPTFPVVAAMPVPSEAAAARVAEVPPLKLIGVAEDAGPNGPVRTAIISGLGQVFLVKEGEDVPPRYRVLKISSAILELTDLSDGTVKRLVLK